MEQQDIYESRAFMFLMIITVFRLVYGVGLNAMPDEADYFVWSERFDWSYYCHPPMLMYFLAAVHQFVHSKTLALRLVAAGFSAGASIYIFHLAVALFDDARRAFHCVALANLTLLFMAGSLLATPDSPMIFFLLGAMYHFYLAVKFGEKKQWLLAGMMTGFALISKFVAFLVYPSFLLYLLLKEHRKWLASAMPYLAFVISLLMFSPVMYWNARHGWTNFAFQLRHGFGKGGSAITSFPHWDKFFEFLGAQAGLIGPIVFVMFAAALLAVALRWKKTPLEEKFLACFASVPLLFFLGASLQKKMEANWACFAYAPGILLTVAFYERVLRPKRWARVLWKIHWGYSVVVLALLFVHIYAPFLPIRKDRTDEFFGWKAFGEEARALAARHPGFELAANRYQIASELIFYSNMWATCFNIESRPNQYDIWQEGGALRGKNYLFFDDGAPKEAVKNAFERFEWLAAIPLKRGERTVKEIQVYQAYNFRRN